MTTTSDVLSLLVGIGGYRELPKPLKIGSISFDFDHALIAESRANDLVVIVELTNEQTDQLLERRLLALTRAMDTLQSKRPVTAILTGGTPNSEIVQSISRVCRVLPVGTPVGNDAQSQIRDWLSVLLPLETPSAVSDLVDWEGDLRMQMQMRTLETSEFVEQIKLDSLTGSDAVRLRLSEAIAKAIESATNRGELDQ